jgi:hypothetical protein
MTTTEIILGVFIVCAFWYIIIRWVHKKYVKYSANREGMESKPYPPKTAFTDPENLPLKEYAIYSSFNSAYDGKQNTIDQLAKNMYGGCRFIDFNVFYANDDLYIGYAVDNAPVMTDTSLKLSQAIEYINNYAFTLDKDTETKVKQSDRDQYVKGIIDAGSMSATTIHQTYINYPLFVNIRVYRPANSKTDIIEKVFTVITGKNGLQNRHSTNGQAIQIGPFTKLNELRKKVIITMDFQNILQIYSGPPPYDATNVPATTTEYVNKMANIVIGGDKWNAFYKYSDVEKNTFRPLKVIDTAVNSKHSYETNTNDMKLVYPYFADVLKNPDSYKYIASYKIQTVPNRFYINDANLERYIQLFKENKTPFLPLYYAHTYINKSNL